MRGYLIIKDSKKKEYLDTFFNAYWQDNLDLTLEKNIIKLLKDLKINDEEFFKNISKHEVKDKLKNFTNDAFKKEIFGAPTFVVNDKIFWGHDRLDYALDELNCN